MSTARIVRAVSPRSYNLGKRKAASEETRGRIIAAARRLLDAPNGVSAFTIDAVAREADVARMTVYYQFASKMGLLEALYDDLAAGSLMPLLPVAMRDPDPKSSLRAVLSAFATFWASDRRIIRRLRALASLDPEVDAGIRNRDAWRRAIWTALVALLGPGLNEEVSSDLVESLLVVTGFESFDKLADACGDEDAARLTGAMARAMFQHAGIEIE